MPAADQLQHVMGARKITGNWLDLTALYPYIQNKWVVMEIGLDTEVIGQEWGHKEMTTVDFNQLKLKLRLIGY